MKKIRAFSIIVLAFSFLLACGLLKHSEAKYGREYNEKRKEVGLPIIGDDWEISSILDGESVWVNPDRVELYNKRVPVHWSKYINYQTGTLISETDTYYGRNDYYIEQEGTYREKLTISYHYQTDPFVYGSQLGWNVRLYNKETYAIGDKEISIEEAEKILAEWGIERLSY